MQKSVQVHILQPFTINLSTGLGLGLGLEIEKDRETIVNSMSLSLSQGFVKMTSMYTPEAPSSVRVWDWCFFVQALVYSGLVEYLPSTTTSTVPRTGLASLWSKLKVEVERERERESGI